MLATRPSYDAYYRRSGQAINMIPHDQLIQGSYESSPYSSKRTTPELETKQGPPRKRVPVACDRCRKRKIKCSGDQGDGSGCENCKSAGWTGCQFLRVRSEALACHTQHNGGRWNSHQQRYHPYSTQSSRQNHYLQQPSIYSSPAYNTWSTVEYQQPTTTSTSMPWVSNGYITAYPAFETDPANIYSTQPPSYMLPDIDAAARASIHGNAISRQQQSTNSIWLDPMNSASIPQQMPQNYPLTPAESTKSYAIFPGQHALSNERILPTPSLGGLASVPSAGHETPPLSAVSHRSSHTWETGTLSNVSHMSSRTSCGGSQDLTATSTITGLPACDEQAAICHYPPESASPQIKIPAAALPIAAETNETSELADTPSGTLPAQEQLIMRSRVPSDSLRHLTQSPYMNSQHNLRGSSQRHQNMLSAILTTALDGPNQWNPSSTTTSRHNSLSSQHHHPTDPGTYNLSDHRSSTTSLGLSTNY